MTAVTACLSESTYSFNHFDQLCSSGSFLVHYFCSLKQFLNIYLSYCVLWGTALQKYPIYKRNSIKTLKQNMYFNFVLTYKPLNIRLLVLKCTTNIYWRNVFSMWTISGVVQAISTVALANVNNTSVSSQFHLQKLVLM